MILTGPGPIEFSVGVLLVCFKEKEKRRILMKDGEKLVIIGCGGVGGPAAMLSKRLMPGVDVTIVREEERFIVR